jgi:two-component system, NarL family, invasion response regulator UvrY
MTAEPATPCRMLLVDDHPVVRRGVHDILARAFPEALIHDAGTGADATTLLRTHRWAIVVLDLTLPDISGLALLKQIREQPSPPPVLVLSMHTADQFGRRAVAAGAAGYLTKDAEDGELVRAVARILRGHTYFPAPVMEQVVVGLQAGGGAPLHSRLSDREHEVLRQIGRGRTVSEIAAELGVSVKTVSTYRVRVLEKLQLRRTAELTRYAVLHGLVE